MTSTIDFNTNGVTKFNNDEIMIKILIAAYQPLKLPVNRKIWNIFFIGTILHAFVTIVSCNLPYIRTFPPSPAIVVLNFMPKHRTTTYRQ